MARSSDAAPRADRGIVVRTPLLPLDTFERWATAADPRALLAELVDRPDVREAIFVATPSLWDHIERWRRDPDSPAGQQIELALARYIARMAGRATPFGLFAGVSAAQLGPATALQLAPRTEYRRRTRLDNDYLFALVDALVRDPDIRSKLRYRPNSSLYELAGRLRYAQARLAGKDRTYHLVAVEPTPYLRATLERCRDGARLDELAAALVADDPELELDEAREFCHELAAEQLVVPELGVTVTGPEPIDALIDQLATANVAEPARVLGAARTAIGALDRDGLGNATSRYVAIAHELEPLPASAELSRLFQVDLVKPGALEIDRKIAAEVVRTIEWLRAIQRPHKASALDRFRTAFTARYELREVPLVEALDQELGVGFETSRAAARQGAPLLEGLVFPSPRDAHDSQPWGPFEHHMVRRVCDAVAAGAREIVLDDSDRRALRRDPPAELSETFQAFLSLAGAPGSELSLLFFFAYGPGIARLNGRFCHASPEIEAQVRDALRAEEALRPDAVYAEIVHLPQGRLGNIMCRPVLRDHEIAYVGMSGAPRDHQIGVDDLLVAVREGRVVLTSRRLQREVIPRLTNAHAFRRRSLPLYHFLCAMGDEREVIWTWGALEALPFLPRVRIGRTVVCRARWNLVRRDLESLGDLRARLGLPRFVGIVDGDNELPIDLDNPLLVRVLADALTGRHAVTLVEMYPAPDASPVTGPEGTYMNEVVMSFVNAPAKPVVTAPSVPTPRVARSFVPGSSWLYAKLYTGTATADRVLREAVAPLARGALARGDASHWFFIRYEDPEHHLRVRFAGDPARLAGQVLPALEGAVAPLVADGSVWRVQLDTYEREVERYGGDQGIDLCEQVFWIDSEAVLAIVESLEGDAGADARWRLALRGAESLLAVLGLDAEARHREFADARASLAKEYGVPSAFFAPIGARYKREHEELARLVVLDTELDASHDLAEQLAILAARDARLAPFARELRARDAGGALQPKLHELAWSLVHMHANRLLHVAQRQQELVLYDLLRRVHEARRARGR